MELGERAPKKRSLTYVSMLLAQCFYLLAVSKTDTCWTTLGVAIRLGQSIGLHVQSTATRDGAIVETRRRLWYSVYVLDRLVALQLGRPPGIHDADSHAALPSRAVDSDESDLTPDVPEEPSVGDYFLCVIRFSSVVGRVLREIYNPRCDNASKVTRTRACDEDLRSWMQALPKHLRFDLCHAFEKSVPFRRQVCYCEASLTS